MPILLNLELILATALEVVMAEAVLVRVVPRLVEVVHVKLPYKRREVIMLKVFGQDLFCELVHLLYDEAVPLFVPANNTG